MQANPLRRSLIVLCATLALQGCPTIAPYNQKSYELTTATKAEALTVLDKATEPYKKHVQEIEALQLSVEKAYEYANGIPKNQTIVAMWNVIRGKRQNPDTKEWTDADNGNLYSTLNNWKTKGAFTRDFVNQYKSQIAKSFDQIIELEGGKNKE